MSCSLPPPLQERERKYRWVFGWAATGSALSAATLGCGCLEAAAVEAAAAVAVAVEAAAAVAVAAVRV